MEKILDIPIYNGPLQKIVRKVVRVCVENDKRMSRCISATGVHGVVCARRNVQFKNVLKSFYLNIPDGMPLVWLGKLKGKKRIERCYGPDFFKKIMIESARSSIKHYLCGGKQGIADYLKRICENKIGNYNIVGTYSPPFREFTDSEFKILAEDINAKYVDIVWIGLSTPKQEFFAFKLAKHTNVHFIITVGAAFDFHTKTIREAPRYIQNIGLEWMFRLLMEPRRLYRRYGTIVPLFMYYNLKEFISYFHKGR